VNNKRLGFCLIFIFFLFNNKDGVMAPAPKAMSPYRQKRTGHPTPEPPGTTTKRSHKKPIFVIQKHDASHLHYDFRLEIDGVLTSWAIPKGPSPDPKDKRLAIQTEDHPLEYARFEGVIPPGSYGAGTVMVWDTGTYRNLKSISMQQCLENGRLEIWLDGTKLQGGYALIKTKLLKESSWLLIKIKDEHTGRVKKPADTSALTGRSMTEIKRDG
jgi:DNA ligase D-like protein (predicted 3'-phosphoesterase)